MLKEPKSKLWVEITPRICCLQKHSHPYNTLSHFYALENLPPVTEEQPSLKQDTAAIRHAAPRNSLTRVMKEREATVTRAKLQKWARRIECIYLKRKTSRSSSTFQPISSLPCHQISDICFM